MSGGGQASGGRADTERGARDARFPATRMTAVLQSNSADEEVRRAAWEELVRAYWKPAYKHVRLRWKAGVEDAKDLTQDFFTRAFDRGFFDGFDAARGRFRTFVRTCLDRHVQNAAARANRDKRGGTERLLSLDFDGAEDEVGRIEVAGADELERVFQREWTRSLFAHAVETLRAELEGRDRAVDWELFRRYDLERGGPAPRPSYDDLAREHDLPASTVTNRLAAVRRTFRRHVLERLRAITSSEAEARDEARELFGGEG